MKPKSIEEQLLRDEGKELKPYLDCCGPRVPWRECPHDFKGRLTIGIGRNLEDRGITSNEAERLLELDIDNADLDVSREYPWVDELDEVRYGALLNLCVNMGIRRLTTFRKMFAALRAEDWERAAVELLDSRYAAQVGQRAGRLAKQLLTGEWQ